MTVLDTLRLLELEGALLEAEHPEHARRLERAQSHGLVYRTGGPGGPDRPRRWRLTLAGRRWLADPWPLVQRVDPRRTIAAARRRVVRAALASGRVRTAELARELGVSQRRVRQIIADITQEPRP